MQLHYVLKQGGPTVVVLLHGLFGSLENLGMLARGLQPGHTTLQVDLPNHGRSPHTPQMSYPLMAQALLALLQQLSLPRVTLIGHSMGGKVAMMLALLAPQQVAQLIVLDIAPISYPVHEHQPIFSALKAISTAHITQRAAAAEIMRSALLEETKIQFLLKSFVHGQWRFNLPALLDNYPQLRTWSSQGIWHGQALFIGGEQSDYIQKAHHSRIQQQFPQAIIKRVANSSHWLHAEQTAIVLRIIRDFITPLQED